MVDKLSQVEEISTDEETLPDPLIGKTLNDRFRIVERLGAGGMGTVYKAVQAPLDRAVALKILNTGYGAGKDPGFQRRFFLEASVTSKLRHPNTITVIDYGKAEDGLFYIAMEYVEGQTLAQLLALHGVLPCARALPIAMQVCRSLREAHKAGVIHRDLKPANVMVLDEENDADLVKVLDFGLVKSFQAEEHPNDTELTQAGVFLGSPQYMAPEQAKNQADPRSDIYSLGVMLYQMLVGEPPFRGNQSIDVIVKHINNPPPPMRARRPELEIPAEVEALVMRCLEKDPAKRFQSMDELLEGLRRAGVAGGLSGVFSANAGSGSGPISGLHTPPPLTRTASISGPQTVALRPQAKLPDALPITVDTQALPLHVRFRLPLAIFGGALVLGLLSALAFALTRPEPKPAPAPPAAAVAPAPAPTPPPPPEVVPAKAVEPAPAATVKFQIASLPAGATVLVGGEPIGVTPTELELPAGEDGKARAALTFTLDGYQPATVTAEGSTPGERVLQKLTKKKAPSRPAKGSGGNRYKDDPYQ